ncbi:MAG: HTH DNA binding domain-containing protein [Promethearchaeota archaeon CR_4]|nr:MAG: HTH DNA binding domain-containing protein [Candidatus Lokiarchaeota archaeon CR_4]
MLKHPLCYNRNNLAEGVILINILRKYLIGSKIRNIGMKKIKKIVLKTPRDQRYDEILKKVERFELMQIHRLDEEFILTTEIFKFRSSTDHPRDLLGLNGLEFIEVLSEDKSKNEYVCFAKTRWPEDLKIFFKDPEIILCVPIIIDEQSILLSFITDSDKAEIVFEQLKRYGDQVKVISISTVLSPNTDNILQLLTERQREIIFYAVEQGYYEIPRKVNTNDLAKKFDISQSALSEHLRKIERVIINSIFK